MNTRESGPAGEVVYGGKREGWVNKGGEAKASLGERERDEPYVGGRGGAKNTEMDRCLPWAL